MPNKLPLLDFAKSYQHRTQNLEMFSAQRRKGNSKKHSDKASSPDDGQQKDAENTKVQVQVEESCSQGQLMASQSPQIPELTPEYLQLLDPLKNIWLFIIQPKVDDFFHPNTTHEISSDKRNLLLKGSFKRKLQLSTKNKSAGGQTTSSVAMRKINLSNLRGKKVATVQFENSAMVNVSTRYFITFQTSNSEIQQEAVIACPAGSSPRCRVIKYGGKFEPPSYSITIPESENTELFTVENSPSNTHGSSTLDYNIFRPNNKLVGRVTSKSGLSFMLHIAEGVTPLDKALLLGFVIAMDMLKQGKSRRKNNEYEYND
ncbi:uncharacterized protein LOC110845368 isoform X2 [Folsomia candida]|uniref:uncharacterized protein LOC110845368 isoform X2 n=1 Tax=Folsomia candida TaxID=158441 RepID=UPI001604AD66|nr:uncharacterized protein LOC110845368 isoform X2 [Folsomia candida]